MEEIFDKIEQQYNNILAHYYPVQNNLGFTEHNLSVAFVEAYKSLHPNSIAWFEAPLQKEEGNKSNAHIDVVLFDLDAETMILVESKRIFDNRKLESAKRDLDRIIAPQNYEYLSRNLINARVSHRIAVILADIWTDKKHKRERLEKWKQGGIFEVDGKYLHRQIMSDKYFILGFAHNID